MNIQNFKNNENIRQTKWYPFKKQSTGIYRLDPDENPRTGSRSFGGTSFSQLAFDCSEERLIASDTRGFLYQFEFRGFADITYKKFEKLPTPTCLAFVPFDPSEIIVASTTNEVIICKSNSESPFNFSAQLSGHRYSVSHITFYKHYCLTVSRKEAIIWDLSTRAKSHQLRFRLADVNLRKAAFSISGQVAALYSNDALQIWSYDSFAEESRVSLADFGLRSVKDFVFTRDGQAIVMCAFKGGLRILDTAHFRPIASLDTDGIHSVPRSVRVIPHVLDAGVARMLAMHFADGSVRFLDLAEERFVEAKQGRLHGIRNFAISPRGCWIAWTEVNGSLGLCRVDELFGDKETMPKKIKVGMRSKAHVTNDHLRSIKEDLKEELGLCRLLPMLEEFGEYPEKHRIVIWSAIMALPMNKDACSGLNENAAQDASIRHMFEHYPLGDRSKASLLASTVDRLVRWCPPLGQCQFLPTLIFPFLVTFQKNRLLALEASITILTNFCQKWFEYYPLPPLNILGMMENVLLESDPALLTCFCERGITSTDYAWPLLRTTLSEVLTGKDWLILWDHIFSFRRPSFLLMCVIAYSICCRETIISVLQNPDDVQRFYSAQGNLSVKKLLKVAQRLDKSTPERIHPDRYLRNDLIVMPEKGPYPPFLMHEYPKFLIEEKSSLMELGSLREEEKILREIRQKSMKAADEKRVRDEIEHFSKEIHRNRMIELRKCHEEQLRMARFNVENGRDEVKRHASTLGETTTRSMEFARTRNNVDTINGGTKNVPISRNMQNWSSNYRELRNQVQELESQVQQFLGGLHTRSS